jgi:hypothetical protein
VVAMSNKAVAMSDEVVAMSNKAVAMSNKAVAMASEAVAMANKAASMASEAIAMANEAVSMASEAASMASEAASMASEAASMGMTFARRRSGLDSRAVSTRAGVLVAIASLDVEARRYPAGLGAWGYPLTIRFVSTAARSGRRLLGSIIGINTRPKG